MNDSRVKSSEGVALPEGGSLRCDLMGVANPLDLAWGGLVWARADVVLSFESLMLELTDGAGEADDRSRRSEAERRDGFLPNMVDNVDLALLQTRFKLLVRKDIRKDLTSDSFVVSAPELCPRRYYHLKQSACRSEP